jgi:hypothetical protein
MLKQNIAHKTTQAIKDTLHILNTKKIQLKLQQIQLQLQLYKLIAYHTLTVTVMKHVTS